MLILVFENANGSFVIIQLIASDLFILSVLLQQDQQRQVQIKKIVLHRTFFLRRSTHNTSSNIDFFCNCSQYICMTIFQTNSEEVAGQTKTKIYFLIFKQFQFISVLVFQEQQSKSVILCLDLGFQFLYFFLFLHSQLFLNFYSFNILQQYIEKISNIITGIFYLYYFIFLLIFFPFLINLSSLLFFNYFLFQFISDLLNFTPSKLQISVPFFSLPWSIGLGIYFIKVQVSNNIGCIQISMQMSKLAESGQNTNINQYYQYYKLEKRFIEQKCPLFKMKKYDKDHIIFTAPDSKCVAIINNKFSGVKFKYYYDHKPLALQCLQLGKQKFVVVGCQNGNIIVTSSHLIQNRKQQSEDQECSDQIEQKLIKHPLNKQQWCLKPKSKQQIFINQIISLPNNPNILINCYNNGNVALWGLLSRKRLHTFDNLHENYTYKLRLQDSNILLSAGHDCSVVRTDLQKLKPMSVFYHSNSVWCVHPINTNQFASVGRFGRVLVWDVRSNRIIQACNNNFHESSFVTQRNSDSLSLFYGDSRLLMKWDRRYARPKLISKYYMMDSAQSILFNKNKMYVCGRGTQICILKGSESLQNSNNMQQMFMSQLLKLKKKGTGNQQSQQMQQQEQEEDWGQEQEQEQNNQDDNQNQSEMIEQQSLPLIKKVENKQQQVVKIQDIAKLTVHQSNILKQKQRNLAKLSQKFQPDFIDSQEQQTQSEQEQRQNCQQKKQQILQQKSKQQQMQQKQQIQVQKQRQANQVQQVSQPTISKTEQNEQIQKKSQSMDQFQNTPQKQGKNKQMEQLNDNLAQKAYEQNEQKENN